MTAQPSGASRKRLDREGCRIIIAIQDGCFGTNRHGRYEIYGQERPDRKTRENLRKRGLIDSRWNSERRQFEWVVTEKGAATLKRDLHDALVAEGLA